jgi:hypothetical protein
MTVGVSEMSKRWGLMSRRFPVSLRVLSGLPCEPYQAR